MPTRLHLIANSHIDPVWLWDRYEGIDEVLNTFRSACDRLDEVPELRFTASSLQFFEWVRQHDAELLSRIQGHVTAGRWEIAGGWWIEPDTNLPSADSFRQQRRQSQAVLDELFPGTSIDVAYVPDSFGHPASLPSLLAETGFRYFLFCRPTAHEKPDLPANLFWWEHEGSRVLAYRVKHHYLQPQPDGDDKDDELRRRLADPEFEANPVNAFLFGLGDHGGGPTKHEIGFYREHMAACPDAGLAFSTCAAFFAEAAASPDIATYEGDLHFHAVGCYSVVRDLKAGVRSAERGLAFAERALTLANDLPSAPAGGLQPGLADAWRRTLFNQFHDILPGSCSPAAADMARAELGGVDTAWRDAAHAACKVMAGATPVCAPEGEFRIVNTLSRPLRAPLAVESFQYFREGAAFCDDTGRELTVQEILPSVRCNNRRWTFIDTLPAGGVGSYHFEDRPAAGSAWGAPHFQAGDAIEAGGLRLGPDGIHRAAGGDGHDAGARLLAPPRLRVLADASDTWGHGVRRYDDVVADFEPGGSGVASGPVVEQLYQRWTYHHSTAEVVWSLYHEPLDDTLEPGWLEAHADLTVNWAEDRRILKWELQPDDCPGDDVLMAGPGGGIRRARNGDEQPLHGWVQLADEGGRTGSGRAFAVLQDGCFAADCAADRLRLNLVRSSVYGFHDPFGLEAGDPQSRTDQGVHRFRFVLRFGAPQTSAALAAAAEDFLEPAWVLREGPASPAPGP